METFTLKKMHPEAIASIVEFFDLEDLRLIKYKYVRPDNKYLLKNTMKRIINDWYEHAQDEHFNRLIENKRLETDKNYDTPLYASKDIADKFDLSKESVCKIEIDEFYNVALNTYRRRFILPANSIIKEVYIECNSAEDLSEYLQNLDVANIGNHSYVFSREYGITLFFRQKKNESRIALFPDILKNFINREYH